MNLKAGTRLVLEIMQAPRGFKLSPLLRLAACPKCERNPTRLGDPRWLTTELDLWLALEELAQDKIARIGMAKAKP